MRPRKTGKSTFLKAKFPDSLVFDFLRTDLFMELAAHSSLSELGYTIDFLRTKSGLEVDFVSAGGEVAIEVKGTARVDNRDLRPLMAFIEEYSPREALVVCNEKSERIHAGIRIMPWRIFLEKVWHNEIIR